MLRSRVLVATGIIVVQSSLLSLDTPTLEASPSGNLSGLRNLLVVGDGFPNTSLVLVEHGYNQHHTT